MTEDDDDGEDGDRSAPPDREEEAAEEAEAGGLWRPGVRRADLSDVAAELEARLTEPTMPEVRTSCRVFLWK